MGQDLEQTQGLSTEMRTQMQWAKLASQGDIIPEAYRGKPANILVAVGFGAAMGLSYSDSLYRINVIKGKPTMSAELIASQVRKAGHKLRTYKDEAHESVKAVIIRKDDPEFEFSAIRDKAWATKMGLANRENYQRQPMTMLTWRAITAVAREACPEALYGVAYSPDELDDMPVVSEREEPAAQPAEEPAVDPSPSKEQCKAISSALSRCGVTSKADAARILQGLTGRPEVRHTDDLTLIEAEDYLANTDVLDQRIRAIMQPASPAAEPAHSQEASDAAR